MPHSRHLKQHPQRVALHNEIHARPPEPMSAPLALTHIVMLTDAAGRDASREHLARLLRDHHLPPPTEQLTHMRADLGAFRLRWEMHTEFVTYTFIRPLELTSVVSQDPPLALEMVPQDWLAGLPGSCLSALHLWALPQRIDGAVELRQRLLFDETLVASRVVDGAAEVHTDFAIHADGYSRVLVFTEQLTPRRLGRLMQRLIEIEGYRMAALLGLPIARDAMGLLTRGEGELASLAGAIRTAQRNEEPRTAGPADASGRRSGRAVRGDALAFFREPRLFRSGEPAHQRHCRDPAGRHAVHQGLHGAAPEPGHEHLRLGRAAPASPVGADFAHEQPAAHARRDRATAKQPGPAGKHEPAPGPATQIAVHRGRSVGGGHHLLHHWIGELPGQGWPRHRLAAVGRNHGRCGHPLRRDRRVVVDSAHAPQAGGALSQGFR